MEEPKCFVSLMCVVSACSVLKLSLHHTHLKMSLVASGPRLIHCDCHALCLGPPIELLPPAFPPVLAISLIFSSGFRSREEEEGEWEGRDGEETGGEGAPEEEEAPARTAAARPGVRCMASGVRKGLRKGKVPAHPGTEEGSSLGALAGLRPPPGAAARAASAGCRLLPDRSRGDSALILSVSQGEATVAGGVLLLVRLSTCSSSSFLFLLAAAAAEEEESPSSSFLGREAAATSCCSPALCARAA